ncbi:MAG: hypothetical protein IJH09_10295 [Clostridia bacterium]|nr:hypothetical protein [Clostridia bacterium]
MTVIRWKRAALVIAALLAALLPGVAAAEGTGAGLVSCELAIFGGMENEDKVYSVRRGRTGPDAVLTVSERGVAEEHALPMGTLDALADFMATYAPESWATLPYREEFALDAPVRSLALTYDDGTEYTLYNDRDAGGPIFAEAERFLTSYLAEGAETFELSFSSFEGGGPSYTPVLSAPEKVWISGERWYDAPADPLPPGSAYTETLVFHGRIPGRTELTIEVSGPLTPVGGLPGKVYVLEVDGDFNVKLVEEREGQGGGPG